jgi:DnaK suppressor protein
MSPASDSDPADRQDILIYFKDLLQGQLAERLTVLQSTGIDREDPVDFSPDPLDQASSDRDRGMMERMRHRESRLIQKIEEALARIEDGTYGICEGCGEEIELARLKARPVATYCIECKTAQEKLERVTG